MPVKTEIRIEGLATLEARLRALPKEVGGNQLRTAVRRGLADPVLADAKRRAPVKSGRLRNAIVKKIVSVKERDVFTRAGDSFEGYDIGVNLGRKRNDINGAWYWWFVENGTEGATVGDGKRSLYDRDTGVFFGKETRGQPARPYLRPAIEENRFELVQSFTQDLNRTLTLAEKKVQRINLKD